MWPDLLGIIQKLVWQRFGWVLFFQCSHQKVVLLGQNPKDTTTYLQESAEIRDFSSCFAVALFYFLTASGGGL